MSDGLFINWQGQGEPATLEEGKERLAAMQDQIFKIDAALVCETRQWPNGLMMTPQEHWRWKSRARFAKIQIIRERNVLKKWMVEKQKTQDTANRIANEAKKEASRQWHGGRNEGERARLLGAAQADALDHDTAIIACYVTLKRLVEAQGNDATDEDKAIIFAVGSYLRRQSKARAAVDPQEASVTG